MSLVGTRPILCVGLAITPFIGALINGEPPKDVNIYIVWLQKK